MGRVRIFIFANWSFSGGDRNDHAKKNMKKPLSVTIIILLVLITGGLNLIRLIQSVKQWALLKEILPFPPLYLTIIGSFWFVVSVLILWGITRRKSWTIRLIQVATILYILIFWIDRSWLAVLESRVTNDLFAVIATLFLGIFVLVSQSRREVKDYFGVSDG